MTTIAATVATLANEWPTRNVGGVAYVATPGKFEGEPLWLVALWDLVLEGCSDGEEWDGETPIAVFTVDADLIAVDPSLAGEGVIRVWEDDSGFVHWRSGKR